MPVPLRGLVVCHPSYSEDTTLVAPPATTPNCEPHTPSPTGYIAESEWADVMMRTHDQRACAGCGLLLVWVPKAADLPGEAL
jgi:hypothetical protein